MMENYRWNEAHERWECGDPEDGAWLPSVLLGGYSHEEGIRYIQANAPWVRIHEDATV